MRSLVQLTYAVNASSQTAVGTECGEGVPMQ